MTTPRRWHFNLRASRWRSSVLALGTAALAAALFLISHAVLPTWHIALHIAIAISLACAFAFPAWRVRGAAAMILETRRSDEGVNYGFWLLNMTEDRVTPEQLLPMLLHYRRYFGLYYLRSLEAELLIWPDSLVPEQHRQLRVLLDSMRL